MALQLWPLSNWWTMMLFSLSQLHLTQQNWLIIQLRRCHWRQQTKQKWKQTAKWFLFCTNLPHQLFWPLCARSDLNYNYWYIIARDYSDVNTCLFRSLDSELYIHNFWRHTFRAISCELSFLLDIDQFII